MPSTRRTVLTSLGTAAATGLSGCFGSTSSSSTPDCSTENSGHAEPELIHAVSATAEDGDVRLVVTFFDDVEMAGLDLVSVADATGDVRFTIPIVAGDGPMGTRRRYEQSLGGRPQHGRYVVAVTDENGDVADEVTADVNCIGESTAE